MISAIVTYPTDARRLTATLASLAPAAMDGIVREALVVGVGASDEVCAAIDDAGAAAMIAASEAEGLAAAVAAARGPWLLILTSRTRLQSGWEGVARRHIDRWPDRAGWFALALEDDGLAARTSEALANLKAGWFGRPEPRQGLLVAQSAYVRRGLRYRPLGARALS